MADEKTPLDILLIQNMALRNILQQVIVQSAISSGDPANWLNDLKIRLGLLDYVRNNAGDQSPAATQLTADVAAEVNKIIGKLKL